MRWDRITLAVARFVSQANYLLDKLLCVCGRTDVVVLLSAQCVVFREYLL